MRSGDRNSGGGKIDGEDARGGSGTVRTCPAILMNHGARRLGESKTRPIHDSSTAKLIDWACPGQFKLNSRVNVHENDLAGSNTPNKKGRPPARAALSNGILFLFFPPPF